MSSAGHVIVTRQNRALQKQKRERNAQRRDSLSSKSLLEQQFNHEKFSNKSALEIEESREKIRQEASKENVIIWSKTIVVFILLWIVLKYIGG